MFILLWFIEDFVFGLKVNLVVEVVMFVFRVNGVMLFGFYEDCCVGWVGGIMVVFGIDKNVLYFLKEVIFYMVEDYDNDVFMLVFYYVGVYVYCLLVLVVYL